MSRNDDATPVETPIPRDCKAETGRPCPYYREVEQVREWQREGLDELVIVSRRRDRWAMAIIGGLIVCLLGLSTTAIWGGWRLAADVGQIGGAMTTRLEQVERQVSQDQTEIQRMSRASSDGQTTVLVTLGEMREQLRAIDARLQRVEDAQGRTRR